MQPTQAAVNMPNRTMSAFIWQAFLRLILMSYEEEAVNLRFGSSSDACVLPPLFAVQAAFVYVTLLSLLSPNV